ncbi:SulP family inorganic anion transporter [Microbacterium sp. 4R-513]|uniref:SulP family inorganic anion transporter n=1 Tax=Microbacterium sp. 4R-513 TaxID=2567934 RepID=UPI0013E1E513|nr:solute carrier family 23 protein [Microbacterium sp. 4R-513]QIG38879.1 SulP family inorganic anion transporter [Microbacterium sp. 4R-513]
MTDTTPPRRRRRTGGLGRPTGRDVVSGFVTGLFSIPEGMAYASIGNFAAPLGLWSGIVPTIIGSMFTRTVLMVTTLTSAIALTSQSVLTAAGLDPGDLGAIATLTVMVGVVMLVMGVLKLGSVMSYVSTAVMTGFTTGIALQIVAGVIHDATGYSPVSSNTVGKILNALANIDQWQLASVLVSTATVAVWVVVRFIKPLRSLATLVALIVVTVPVALLGLDVEYVSDIATIPRSLPPLSLPDLAAIPGLATGAVAVALVALAQAAGISAAVSNPDGSRSDASKDFTAQGLANIAGGFFSALPTGGSMSRTGVAMSAGAQTRWSGIFAGLWLALIVLLVGPFAGYIPMPVIGGLMIVIGGELVVGRWPDIVLVFRTSALSAAALLVTFVATTALPLQQAIFIGAGLSIILSVVALSRTGRMLEVVRDGDGWVVENPPEHLPSHRTTVLHYTGGSIFAEVNRLQEDWPRVDGTTDAAIVLSMRGSPMVPSATFLKALDQIVVDLRKEGISLVLCGVPPKFAELLTRTGRLTHLGPENVVVETPRLAESLETAYERAETLRAQARNEASRNPKGS